MEVHLWDLHPSTYLHFDEYVREQVRAPRFGLHTPLYRRIRRRKVYLRKKKDSEKRVGVPCKGRPVPIRYFKKLATKLSLPRSVLETHVDYVKAAMPGNAAVLPLRFPLKPTVAHAFLAGLWQSCGGILTRERDQVLRFSVEPEVVAHLLSPDFVAQIGESPRVGARSGMMNRMKTEKWPRKVLAVHYCRTTLSIMQTLLQMNPEEQKRGVRRGKAGRYIGFRELNNHIPDWIVSNPKFIHAYVEGYLNSNKMQVWACHSSHRLIISMNIGVRFNGVSKEATRRLAETVGAHLRERGVVGKLRSVVLSEHHRLNHLEYCISSAESYRNLIGQFHVRRWKIRLLVRARLDKDPRWLKVLQYSDIRMIVIAALLKYEGPKSHAVLSRKLAMRPIVFKAAIARLLSRGIIIADGGLYRFDASGFLSELASDYRRRIEKNEANLHKLETSLPTIQVRGGEVPVRRGSVMKPLRAATTRLRLELRKVSQQ
jgi:hypothetical protein